MSYFVVVPGALVPAAIAPALLARVPLPRLVRRLQHARAAPPEHVGADGAAHRVWLWTRFGGDGTPVTAPYAWRALNRAGALDVAADQPLWHADPVHFAFARDHMLVTALDDAAALTPDEASALAADAAAIAVEFGATLRVIDTRHWFVAFEPAWSIEAPCFDAALGRSVQDVLPRGSDAARWRKLLTEIQIRWHQHPVNQAREERDVATVNGVWLYGGGRWRELPQRPFGAVAADDPAIRGWAMASGLAPTAVFAGDALPDAAGPILVYRPELLRSATAADWDGWTDALARLETTLERHVEHAYARRFAEVILILGGRHTIRSIRLRATDRFRLWHRNRVAELLAEAEAT
jgi:hypothetical protein